MRTSGFILLAAILLLCGSVVRAQEQAPRAELFIQGGPSLFTSDNSSGAILRRTDSFSRTGRVSTGARYYLNAGEALEGSYSFSPNRHQRRIQFSCPPGLICVDIFFPPFTTESMNVHALAFNYVRYLRTEGRVRPFVTGGLGFTVFDPESFGTETQFTGNFGGGVDIRLAGRVALRSEIRDSIVRRPSFAGGGTAHHVTPSVGLAFTLAQQDAAAARLPARDAGPLRVELFVEGGASWFSGRPSRVSVFGPVTAPLFIARTESHIASTGRVIAGGRYYFTENNAAEASYGFTPTRQHIRLSFTISPFPPEEISGDFDMDVHTFAFNYVRYLTRRGRLEPFVTGGLGFQVFSAFGVGTEFAGNFGGGVDVRLHPRVALRAELRDFISERPPFTSADIGRTTHNGVPSVGFAFKIR